MPFQPLHSVAVKKIVPETVLQSLQFLWKMQTNFVINVTLRANHHESAPDTIREKWWDTKINMHTKVRQKVPVRLKRCLTVKSQAHSLSRCWVMLVWMHQSFSQYKNPQLQNNNLYFGLPMPYKHCQDTIKTSLVSCRYFLITKPNHLYFNQHAYCLEQAMLPNTDHGYEVLHLYTPGFWIQRKFMIDEWIGRVYMSKVNHGLYKICHNFYLNCKVNRGNFVCNFISVFITCNQHNGLLPN